MTRETVLKETPASCATSLMVAMSGQYCRRTHYSAAVPLGRLIRPHCSQPPGGQAMNNGRSLSDQRSPALSCPPASDTAAGSHRPGRPRTLPAHCDLGTPETEPPPDDPDPKAGNSRSVHVGIKA